jgi:serine/threonine-protein kinase
VHRDIKCSNILVTPSLKGKLTGLELATFPDDPFTKTGPIVGTPEYMAPEQALGQAVDPRADIYSLGICLYEAFTGSVPFEGESFMDVLTQQITSAPEPVGDRAIRAGRDLPGGLGPVVTRALEKDPQDRHQTIGDLSEGLEGILHALNRRADTKPGV